MQKSHPLPKELKIPLITSPELLCMCMYIIYTCVCACPSFQRGRVSFFTSLPPPPFSSFSFILDPGANLFHLMFFMVLECTLFDVSTGHISRKFWRIILLWEQKSFLIMFPVRRRSECPRTIPDFLSHSLF